MSNDPKTAEEYVMQQFNGMRAAHKQDEITIKALTAENEKLKALQNAVIIESPFKCYSHDVIRSYDRNELITPVTLDELKILANDDTELIAWAKNAYKKNTSYWSNNNPVHVIDIREHLYSYEILHGPIKIGIYVYKSGGEEYNESTYLIDNKSYFSDPEEAYQAGLKKLKEVIQDWLRHDLKEAEAAAQTKTDENK